MNTFTRFSLVLNPKRGLRLGDVEGAVMVVEERLDFRGHLVGCGRVAVR